MPKRCYIIKLMANDLKQFADTDIFLGLDFGTRHIGVASGQKITATATPVKTLIAKNGVPNWMEVDKIIAEWHPAALIVGIPFHLDGTAHWVTKAAENFILSLKSRYRLPVYGVNEQLTTKSAKERVFAAGGYKALQKEELDSIAAKLILEGWLTEQNYKFTV